MKNIIISLVLLISIVSCSVNQTESKFDKKYINLNGKWRFCIDSAKEGLKNAYYKNGLPQGETKNVDVPHTWNIQEGLENYHGWAWYSKIFDADAGLKGKLNRIKFDAVYHTATVWVNGQKLKKHIGSGYTPFYVDVSEVLKYDAENTITLLVDNAFSRQAIPWGRSFDWAADGGITRDVKLISTGKPAIQYAHFTPAVDLKTNKGKVQVDLSLLEIGQTNGTVDIVLNISKEGDKVKTYQVTKPVSAEIAFEFEMDDVALWHFDHPHVYDVKVSVEKQGIQTDHKNEAFGFRKFEVKGDELYLNGESVRLMAVEWMPGSSLKNGMAETETELIENLQRIKEVNCVLTRFHWQQDEAVFDWCDRNGILVQEEVPVWGNMMPPWNDTIMDISLNQLDEMINEHYNHPSIVMWGVGNEYTKKGTPEFIQRLYDHCKQLDPNRLVNYVSNGVWKDFEEDGTNQGDILMWNDYTDTWIGKPIDKTDDLLDAIHEHIPGKPLMISEYGLCEPHFKGGDERRIEQLITHNKYYDPRSWVVGAIYFSLNDYRTHMGEAGEGIYKQRIHGVYDIYEKPKPSKDVLKRISAPLTIADIQIKEQSMSLVVKCKNKMPSYTCAGYYITLSEKERGKELIRKDIPLLKPGQKAAIDLQMDVNAEYINIYRPNGFHVVSEEAGENERMLK